jgi:hypothetical protein
LAEEHAETLNRQLEAIQQQHNLSVEIAVNEKDANYAKLETMLKSKEAEHAALVRYRIVE